MKRFEHPYFVFSLLVFAAGFYAACAPISDNNGPSGAGSSSGSGSATGSGSTSGDGDLIFGGDGDVVFTGNENSGAFPEAALAVGAIDPSEVTVFADPENFSPGVCVYEPHLSDDKGVGALFPPNWLRPRFRWTGTGSETLWEIRLSAVSQMYDMVIYTRETEWIMPKEYWVAIADGVRDDITVTIRGNAGGSIVGMRGSFRVAPTTILAGGSMVFWGTASSEVAPGSSRLYGFTVGDEAVVNTLSSDQVTSVDRVYNAKGTDLRGELQGDDGKGDYIAGFDIGKARCIGCHSATPDGAAMIFTDDYPWNAGIASVAAASTGAVPDYVTPQALQFLKMPFLGTGMMLPAAWASGDRTLITTRGRRADATPDYVYINYGWGDPMTFEPNVHDLIWIDLGTTAFVSDTLPDATGDATGAPPWPVYYTGEERIAEAASRGDEILAAEGSAWGVLISEAGSISNPTPAKLTNRIAYTVSESSFDGHPDWHNNTADIKIADLASTRTTATGAPVPGASDPGFLEYYPAFSPDDQFLAFTRAPTPSVATRCAQAKQMDRTADPEGGPTLCDNYGKDLGAIPDGPYYNRNGEIYVVPAAGGEPHRLRGNDPVMCSGENSPGVINSWPKWSSVVRPENPEDPNNPGKNYYFVIFSSARGYPGQFNLTPTPNTPPIDTRSSQLYMSVVEHDPATGAIVSYAPIYLWNQNYLVTGADSYEPLLTANLTPAWEDFSIPEVPPTVIVR